MGQKIFILTIMALTIAGCNYNVSKIGQGSSGLAFTGLSEKTISYSRVSELVLKPYCLDCHSNAGKDMVNAGDVNLETYQNLKLNLDLILGEVNSGSMPPKNKPQGLAWFNAGPAVKDYFMKWVELGANEGDVDLPQQPEEIQPDPTPIVIPPIVLQEIRYADVNTALVEAFCLRCHNNDKQKGDINLQGYENLKQNIQDSKFQIEIGEMPPKAVQIPDEVMKLVDQWIEQGMRE